MIGDGSYVHGDITYVMLIMTLFEIGRLIVIVISLAGIGWILFDFIKSYLGASGSRWTRILFAFEFSATILWARFVLLVGLAAAGLSSLAGFLGLPEVSAAFNNYMTPTNVSLLVAGIAVVTELCRRRGI